MRLPYAYLPLSSEVHRRPPDRGDLRGWIEYTLTTRTPTFVGATKVGNEIRPFLTPDGFLAIPSTEMKSLARRAFESQSSSCVSSLEKDRTFRWKNVDQNAQPGLLSWQNNHWNLDPAEAPAPLPPGVRVNEATRTVTSGGKHYQATDVIPGGGILHFAIHAIGQMGVELVPWTFAPSDPSVKIAIPSPEKLDAAVKRYVSEVITRINEKSHNPWLSKWWGHIGDDNGKSPWIPEAYIQALKNPTASKRIPVYYQTRGGNVYLYHAPVMKLLGTTTFETLVGDHLACSQRSNMCPACNLFGLAGELEEAADAWGSRLAFSVARCNLQTQGALSPSQITWFSPSSPKASLELTVEKPSLALADQIFPDLPLALLGRKYYLPHVPTPTVAGAISTIGTRSDAELNEQQDVRFTPIRAGVTFSGRIDFEDLNEAQLSDLLKVLQTEGDAVHQLGMAKPWGFGSVQIAVTRVIKVETNDALVRSEVEMNPAGLRSQKAPQSCLKPELRTRWNQAKSLLVTSPDQQPFEYPNRDWHRENKLRIQGLRWIGGALGDNP